jgi:hypothetical protein
MPPPTPKEKLAARLARARLVKPLKNMFKSALAGGRRRKITKKTKKQIKQWEAVEKLFYKKRLDRFETFEEFTDYVKSLVLLK